MLAAECAPPASAPVEVNELQPVLTVFCVDTSPEMDVEMGPYINVSKPRLHWLRLLIARFVRARALVSAAHQTALMTFAAQATWLCDFTNDAAVIERKLGEVALASHDECRTFDVLTAVEMAVSRFNARRSDRGILQIVLLYARSSVKPVVMPQRPAYRKCFDDGRVFLDIVYMHEKPDNGTGMMQSIYDTLLQAEVDQQPSYVYELTRSVKRLMTIFGNLLAVPSQRPIQEEATYANFLPGAAAGVPRSATAK